jgi:hypothetical protein
MNNNSLVQCSETQLNHYLFHIGIKPVNFRRINNVNYIHKQTGLAELRELVFRPPGTDDD